MVRDVITIDRNKTVLDACNIYKEYRIGCLVVTDEGSCIGIVTERDLIERTICLHRDPEKTEVGDIMSPDIKTVHALEKLEKAVNLSQDRYCGVSYSYAKAMEITHEIIIKESAVGNRQSAI